MADLLYLLHFDDPLHHAKHYLGSTTRVAGRLHEHATGQGARLTQVLCEKERGWVVAALWQPIDPNDDIRALERKAKQNKNSTTFCPICNPEARSPKGTISIPIPNLNSKNTKDSTIWPDTYSTHRTPSATTPTVSEKTPKTDGSDSLIL